MSVIESQKGENKFEVLIKSRNLASYTINICDNDKVFTKEHKESLTRKITDIAIDIFCCVNEANEIVIRIDLSKDDLSKNLKERQELQYKAIRDCKQLLSLIQIAKPVFHLTSKRVKYWGEMTIEVRTLIQRWKDADRNRLKAYL